MANRFNPELVQKCFFVYVLSLLLVVRGLSLYQFGFLITDLDQLVIWNGAVDYAQGIFHEPYFYGQNYNYMLESLLAVPLLYAHLPVYQALPLISSLLTILPYVSLGFFLFRRKTYFWATFIVGIPLILPWSYFFLSGLPRGFVQAHLLIPFLLIPMFNPTGKWMLDLTFFLLACCFLVNPSSLLFGIPVVAYVLSHNKIRASIGLKAFWILPVALFHAFSKWYYYIHPEQVLHSMSGMKLDAVQLLRSLLNPNLVEELNPIQGFGMSPYLIAFGLLICFLFMKSMRREGLFVVSALLVVLMSLAVPKVQEVYPLANAGVFFSSSRFYLLLPFVLGLSVYLAFKTFPVSWKIHGLLVGVLSLVIMFQLENLESQSKEEIMSTSFPVAKVSELKLQAEETGKLVAANQIGLIVYRMSPEWDWKNALDCYAYYPLQVSIYKRNKPARSVYFTGDRRTWNVSNMEVFERVLMIGFSEEELKRKGFETECLDKEKVLLKHNKLVTASLLKQIQ